MPSVDTLDTLVHTVIYTLWALFAGAFIAGAVLLHRHNAGLHHSAGQAVDTGHQPAHARPPWWTRLGEAWLATSREAAAAYALVKGQPHVA